MHYGNKVITAVVFAMAENPDPVYYISAHKSFHIICAADMNDTLKLVAC